MMTAQRAFLVFACAGAALSACDVPNIFGGRGGRDITLTLVDVPRSDTLRQTGLEFGFESDGARPYRSVIVVADPGTPSERFFPTDSAWRAEAPERFPVVVTGPLSNGIHFFELRVVDADGQEAKAQFSRVTHVPDVAYTLQFLGAGFDDSRASGITASGGIAGTVFSGVSPSQTSQIVAWNNGTRAQPRTQSGITNSSALGINAHGEIVGNATVDGSSAGVLWRTDSLEVLSVNNQRSFQAFGIDDAHRALLMSQSISLYFVDINSGSTTSVGLSPADLRMNGLGQLVSLSPQLYGTAVNTYGGITIRFPDMRPGRHERLFRGTRWYIMSINDRSEVLGTREGDPFLSQPDAVQYIDHLLPPAKQVGGSGAYTLAASGDVVSLRGTDSLFLWSREKGTRRITFTNPGWTLDGIGAMNASGHLLAHGVNTQTGRKGALLLSPANASAKRE